MDIKEEIKLLKNLDYNDVLYSTRQANDNKLGKTNPYAVNRNLYLIGDILEELLNRIETLEKEKGEETE